METSCAKCKGTGSIDTGNNDLPCDCAAGDTARFNVAGRGQVSGAVLKNEAAQRRQAPLPDYLR